MRPVPHTAIRYLLLLFTLTLAYVCHGNNTVTVTQYIDSKIGQPIGSHINDYANIVSYQDARKLQTLLDRLLTQKGVSLVITTIDTLNGYELEPFSTALFNYWGVGNAQKNNGILMLVALEERKIRIELGAGYSSEWNGYMKSIIDKTIVPFFKNDQHSSGILAGALAISDIIEIEAGRGEKNTTDQKDVMSPFTYVIEYIKNGLLFDFQFYIFCFGVLCGFGYWLKGYLRRRPRRCSKCSSKMHRLDEHRDDTYLDEGKKKEEELNSIDYDVWVCHACDGTHIIPYETGRFETCPHCQYKTLETTSIVIKSATTSTTGIREEIEDCKHCDHHQQVSVTIPVVIEYDNDDDYDSFGGSDSSYDGGSSSGGGASGSW